jgi:bifunctional DNA-binding transcriptional regulator/antitoxin component of YhaV-PrlF toxin-antitoxin module
MVKIQELPNGQLVITIPKRLAEYEGLDKGDELVFEKHEKGFILKRVSEEKTRGGKK